MSSRNLFYLWIFLLLVACKTQPPTYDLKLSDQQTLVFLNQKTGGEAIVKDEVEGFFDKINILDMSIQMRQNFPAGTTRAQALEAYRTFLKKDTQSFTKEEVALLGKVFADAYLYCQQLNPDIFPNDLQLIKSDGAPYGPDAFYTRGKSIVIPAQMLREENFDMLVEVALHEIFHIYSRYHPEEKKALYQLVGFKGISDPENLILPDSLQQRILLNPDGINHAWLIRLTTPDGKNVQAIPMIVSTEKKYQPAHPEFFSYLQFDLYQIQPPISRRIQVMAKADGTSLIDYRQFPDFFRQIGDNTGYIIHPDEILADNFMLLALTKSKHSKTADLSESGQQLLSQIEQILIRR